jgi:hypothetical protein
VPCFSQGTSLYVQSKAVSVCCGTHWAPSWLKLGKFFISPICFSFITRSTHDSCLQSKMTAARNQKRQDRQCMRGTRNSEARSPNYCCSGNALSIKYYECASVSQHEMRMRLIVICSLSGCTINSTLSHKWHDFRKRKGIEHKVCFHLLCNFSLRHSSF